MENMKKQCVQYYDSPLGRILLAGEGEELTGLWFQDQKHYASTLEEGYEERDLPVLDETKRWLDLYFRGSVIKKRPAIRLKGTAFQIRVWEELLKIGPGQTLSYKELGERIYGGKPFSAQAIGMAVGRNPISIIVPCHRVLGADGSLRGYAGGLDRKRWLLDMEKMVKENEEG